MAIFPLGLVGGLFSLFPPIATKLLFSYAIPDNRPVLVEYLAVGLLFAACGSAFFYFLRGLLTLRVEGLSAHLIQTALWDRLLKLSPSFFRKFSVGNLFWRVFAVEEIRLLFAGYASTLIISGIFAVLYLLLMFFLFSAPISSCFFIGCHHSSVDICLLQTKSLYFAQGLGAPGQPSGDCPPNDRGNCQIENCWS